MPLLRAMAEAGRATVGSRDGVVGGGATIGRLWLLTPGSMFNLAGAPVTEVPLVSAAGLPLGIQVERDSIVTM